MEAKYATTRGQMRQDLQRICPASSSASVNLCTRPVRLVSVWAGLCVFDLRVRREITICIGTRGQVFFRCFNIITATDLCRTYMCTSSYLGHLRVNTDDTVSRNRFMMAFIDHEHMTKHSESQTTSVPLKSRRFFLPGVCIKQADTSLQSMVIRCWESFIFLWHIRNNKLLFF